MAAIAVTVVALIIVGAVALRGSEQSQASGSAHAGHDMSTHAKPATGSVDVELGEFYVKPASKRVAAGTIAFEITNAGSAEHELMIADVETLPPGDVEGMSSDEVHDRVLASKHGVAAGSDARMVVELEPGTYLLFCNMSGHFGQGQSITIEVV